MDVISKMASKNLKDNLRKKLAIRKGPKKICLNMIVKNESKIIRRLLESLKDIVDMISIVDTGSTDNTEELIIKWGKENNIPTVVHHEPFKNFAYNRTHSIQMAKKTFPTADYFLLSDADFIWEKNGYFNKTLLTDHRYFIRQYNNFVSYWNVRLLSANIDWECVGVTHEYWRECKKQSKYQGIIRTSKITSLVINDREDGGCKTDKFIRDERLLLQGLKDPNTPKDLLSRYKFYLAQTYRDLQRYYDSIEWYKKRIEDQGWSEEVFYSKFQIGFNYEQIAWNQKKALELMKKDNRTSDEELFLHQWNPTDLTFSDFNQEVVRNFKEAGRYYLDAYNYRKTRSESLYYLVRMYRMLEIYPTAFNFALVGKTIKYPEEDILFVENACYDYLFDYEICMTAWYLNKKDIGRESLAKLIFRNDLPEWIKNSIKELSRIY